MATAIFTTLHRKRFLAEDNDPVALCTPGGFILRRVFQFLEIVFIGSIPDIHFRVEAFPAFRAILPVSAMRLNMVKATQGVTAMIPVTTVAGV